jgi:hypothetical protein
MEETVATAVKSGLYIVEKNLNMIMRMFVRPNERSIMRSTRNDIDPAVKSRMLIIIDSMFSEIAFLKKTFNLETVQESASWMIHSFISEVWTVLEDCMPEKLTAYGKVTEADIDTLNQHIRALLEMNDQLLEELRAASPTNNSASASTERWEPL